MIIPIFDPRAASSVLAHDPAHCVPGITLSPGDANNTCAHVFIVDPACLGSEEDAHVCENGRIRMPSVKLRRDFVNCKCT